MTHAVKTRPVLSANRVVRAEKCDSSFPAEWLDKSFVEVEHDESDPICDCADCTTAKRLKTRTTSERLLKLYSDNDQAAFERSTAETVRPPALPPLGYGLLELELEHV